jgi:hypothetical protein
MTTPFDKYNSAPECVSAVAALLLDGHKRVTVQNIYKAINELRCSKKQYTNIKGFKEMIKHAIDQDKMRQWPHVNCACFKMDTGRAYEAYVCHEKSVASKQKQTADQEVSSHWIVTQVRAKHDFETMSDKEDVPAAAEVVVDDVVLDAVMDVVMDDEDEEEPLKGYHSDKHAEESREIARAMWDRKPDIELPHEGAPHTSRFHGDAANIAHQIRAYLFPKKDTGSRKGVSAYRDAYSVEHVQMHKKVTDYLDEVQTRHLGRGITEQIQGSAKIIHAVLNTNLKDDFKDEQVAEILTALQCCMW